MSRKKTYKVGQILEDEKNERYRRRVVVTKIDDTEEAYTVHTSSVVVFVNGEGEDESRVQKGTLRRQKYLCFGGPKDGQRLTEEDAPRPYVLYNSSVRWGKREPHPTAVLVYLEKL